MPQVEFHVLSAAGDDARVRHVCALVNDAYEQAQRVFIYTTSETDARRVDELLWTFRDQAFIPHEVAATPSHPRIVALIGINSAAPAEFASVLINLSNEVPPAYESFARIVEIIDADPQRKQTGRERYKHYRDRGCTLDTRNI